MADNLQPTPRNQLLGLLSDAMYGGLDWMKDPRRSQQMQGLAGLLESTGIPKTTERMAYGEPLTNIGRANVPLLKPETAEAMMTVAPLAPAVGKAGKGIARMAGSEINAAMMGERGGLLGAMTPQPKQIFIGENAKTWNKAGAEKFLQLEKSGADPVTAWQQTGTFRSPDGKLRQEISDKSSQITDEVFSGIKANQEFQGTASEALTHPELYAAYPDVANIKSGLYANPVQEGSYHVPTDTILAGGAGTGSQRSVMLHELQHAVQQRENFAGGSSPNSPYPAGVRDKMIQDQFEQLKALTKYDPTNPYSSPNALTDKELLQIAIRNTDAENGSGRTQAYRLAAGEAEARAVQNRMNMTPEQRLQKFPLESYDVPVGSLLFPTP